MNNRKLVLENGRVFEGKAFGSNEERVAELEEATEKKFCSHCKERKPITAFNKNRS